jgi:hypothetical protein
VEKRHDVGARRVEPHRKVVCLLARIDDIESVEEVMLSKGRASSQEVASTRSRYLSTTDVGHARFVDLWCLCSVYLRACTDLVLRSRTSESNEKRCLGPTDCFKTRENEMLVPCGASSNCKHK